jgi:hypothetical protein
MSDQDYDRRARAEDAAQQPTAASDRAADLAAIRARWTEAGHLAEQYGRSIERPYAAAADIRALLARLDAVEAELQAVRDALGMEVQLARAVVREARELHADVERWRESGGDMRDLGYVLETADRVRSTLASYDAVYPAVDIARLFGEEG